MSDTDQQGDSTKDIVFPFELGPDAEVVWTMSFLLELPGNLRVSRQRVMVSEDGGPWDGWDPETVAMLVGEAEMPAGHRPVYSLRFDHADVRGRVILQAADKAFPNWDVGVNGWWTRFRRHLRLWRVGLRGEKERHTVILISHYLWKDEDLLRDGESFHEWTSRCFDEALEIVNQYVVGLAASTDEVQHSALSRIDLPHTVPMLLTADPPPEYWQDRLWMFDAHATIPIDREEERTPEEVAQVVQMVNWHRVGRFPFFAWIELYQAAEHHLAAGRYMQSVISSTTGIEVLVNTIVRVSWGLRRYDATKLPGILDSGFKNLMTQHLAKLLGEPIDLSDEATPAGRWHRDCYLLRNRVVHEGHKPSAQEALKAKLATGAFARWFGGPLRRDIRTRGLGEYLATEPETRPADKADASSPD